MPTLPPDPTPDDEIALQALFAQEDAALAERRRLAMPKVERLTAEPASSPTPPRVGLAISGGGIRSATFGLGLLRGLAQQGLLTRLDYLSTVSGGGFVGAMFGRLVEQLGISKAQAELARANSAALDWLRRNGRYLTPAGARDLAIAGVTYLRAFLAIHFESLLACLPLAVLVMAPHLLQQGAPGFDPTGWQVWHTLWWPLALALWLATAPGVMAAYWVARDTPDPNLKRSPPGVRDLLFLALFMLTAVWASFISLQDLDRDALFRGQSSALMALGGLLALWSCLVGLIYTQLRLMLTQERRALAVARIHNLLTQQLRTLTLLAVGMFALGALDVLSWWLLEAMQNDESWVQVLLGVGSLAVVVLRALAEPLQRLAATTKGRSMGEWGPTLLNVAGLVGLLVLLCAWLVAAQWLVFTAQPISPLTDYAPSVRALGLLGLGCAWWLLTGRNEQMANASSLHSFYRERLTRAYLAVCNPKRGLLSALAEHNKTDVTAVVQKDDLDMRKYQPEFKGGPIHLVNACLNQTRDDSSGLYNADRKGALLTVSSRAIEVGTRVAVPLPATQSAMVSPSADVGTLGRWVAVSGAAASPGAGSYTSFGWAVLFFFLGLRLGYWMRAPHGAQGVCPTGLMRLWKWAVKPLMLWSEVSATFFGRARPWWYLSDGGHFENTGVYALLKRRLDFIIVADNGADPDYQFGDLENLVRKARIDFGAEIEFYTREEAARHFPDNDGRITVLSPQDMADNRSVRGVMLARVRYAPDGEGARHEATLLIVKPNQHDALDLDLLAYAQRHPEFPHESTGDQSFDEAQWESYQRLGEDLGRALNPAWLKQLPGWLTPGKHPLTVGARLRTAPPLPQAAKANEPLQPLSRRSARNGAIGATLGLGASGTLLLALWQVSEDMREARATEQAETRQLFTEVSRDLRDLDGACPKVADHTTVQLKLLREMRAGTTLRPVERAGVDQLLDRVRKECAKPAALSTDCQNAVRHASVGVCAASRGPAVVGTALSYWHPSPAPITLSSLLFGPAEQPQARVSDSTVATQTSSSPRPTQALPAQVVPPRPSASAAVTGAPVATLADACARDEGSIQLYVRIYDEASRNDATELARLLQTEGGPSLLVAPVEDVTRSAELRQQSRPVPWPQPTLIVHDAADNACALSLANAIGKALAAQGRSKSGEVWLRGLPKSLKPRSGVVELWLPPQPRVQTNSGGV